MAREVALGALRNAAAAPGNEDILRERCIGVLDLYESELNAAFIEVLDQISQFTTCVISRQNCGCSEGNKTLVAPVSWRKVLTSGVFNLENTLLGTTVLESIHQGSLDGEERPLCKCGRGASGRRAIDHAIVAALYGRAVDGQVQRRHVIE